MPMSGNITGREYNKFVQSPTRSDGSAVEVVGSFTTGGSTPATTTILNQELENAGQEYQISIPANCSGIYLKSRSIARLKLAFVLNGTNTNYFTIPLGGMLNLDRSLSATEIYIQSDRANTIIEVLFLTT